MYLYICITSLYFGKMSWSSEKIETDVKYICLPDGWWSFFSHYKYLRSPSVNITIRVLKIIRDTALFNISPIYTYTKNIYIHTHFFQCMHWPLQQEKKCLYYIGTQTPVRTHIRAPTCVILRKKNSFLQNQSRKNSKKIHFYSHFIFFFSQTFQAIHILYLFLSQQPTLYFNLPNISL